MKLELVRLARIGEGPLAWTAGRLLLDGATFCWTCEDPERTEKAASVTAIPRGVYSLTLRTQGDMHQRYSDRWDWHRHGMLWIRQMGALLCAKCGHLAASHDEGGDYGGLGACRGPSAPHPCDCRGGIPRRERTDFERAWEYVYLHPGNRPGDTRGCPLVGYGLTMEGIAPGQSTPAYARLYPRVAGALRAGELVELVITAAGGIERPLEEARA